MEKEKAKLLFKTAMDYIKNNDPRGDLEWLRNLSPETFKNITSEGFLWHYCWVIYGSGFKVSIIEGKFDSIKRAFKDFDIEKISKMKSVEAVLRIFNNERKANSFLEGVKLIHKEGFSKFKERIQREGMTALVELPGIGDITKKLLARNIGLADVAKDDVHVQRLVKLVSAVDMKELIDYLSDEFGEKKGVVDGVLWNFCEQEGWTIDGYDSLDDFIARL